MFYLRGPSARFNFPELLAVDGPLDEMSAAVIREKAIEVGVRDVGPFSSGVLLVTGETRLE
ncbi:hypothetical protein Hdeb2414_s0270g00853061 [Helianthus debilis subsp. tardiflorus]